MPNQVPPRGKNGIREPTPAPITISDAFRLNPRPDSFNLDDRIAIKNQKPIGPAEIQ